MFGRGLRYVNAKFYIKISTTLNQIEGEFCRIIFNSKELSEFLIVQNANMEEFSYHQIISSYLNIKPDLFIFVSMETYL